MKRNNLVMATALAAVLAGPQASAFAMDAPYTPPMGTPTTQVSAFAMDASYIMGTPTADVPLSYPGVVPPAPVDQGISADDEASLDFTAIDADVVLTHLEAAQAQNANNGLFNVGLQAIAQFQAVAQLNLLAVAQPQLAGFNMGGIGAAPWHYQTVAQPNWTLPGLTGDYNRAKKLRDDVDVITMRIDQLTIDLRARWDYGCFLEERLRYWARVAGTNCQAYRNYLVLWRIAVKNYLIDYNAQKRLIAIRAQKTANGTIDWHKRTHDAWVRMMDKLTPPQPIVIPIPPMDLVPPLNPPFQPPSGNV